MRQKNTPKNFGSLKKSYIFVRRVKAYERLASKAIREKSRTAAIDCLTLHPLVNSYSLAVKLVDSYIALNAGYSDGWK